MAKKFIIFVVRNIITSSAKWAAIADKAIDRSGSSTFFETKKSRNITIFVLFPSFGIAEAEWSKYRKSLPFRELSYLFDVV